MLKLKQCGFEIKSQNSVDYYIYFSCLLKLSDPWVMALMHSSSCMPSRNLWTVFV